MEAAPYFLTLAAACAVFSYGLMNRTAWMWRLSWLLFYLFAAKFGEWFFAALREAQNGQQVVWACIYLAGGLVLWYPCVVWWSKQRRTFGIRDDISGPTNR